MNNLYVDIHVIQDIPPANLNRDDSGSPKTATYGGVERLRVSSQAWKRATRKDFANHLPQEDLGIRTRRVEETLIAALVSAGVPEESATALAGPLLEPMGIKAGKKAGQTAYLVFLSRPQLVALAEKVMANRDLWDDTKALIDAVDVLGLVGRGHSLDVAAFGRMVADLPDITVDAAVQVAHALGTHAAPTQFDYFTAVDDAQERDETGAGMIGTVEFNSATVYRYASINVPALIENMADQEKAMEGVGLFVRSFISSLPTGKQNTFAAHSRPALVYVAIRDDRPVNYMSAFEKPVQAGNEGYISRSVKAFAEFVDAETKSWGDKPLATFAACSTTVDCSDLGERVTFAEIAEKARGAVMRVLTDE